MSQRLKTWVILAAIAGTPRLLGAFFLPNTFGDAYVYIRDIGTLSTKIRAGTFAFTDLYGFWLPLYQVISALINVFVGNGFYVGKIVSAIFGVGVCLLVYPLTLKLTAQRSAALLSFALIALSPLHILTSTSALTDVPHAFFVLGRLYFVFTRVESWMLIALIPFIQLLKERKVSVPAIAIMIIPPFFWFYVSWKAAGDWLACFRMRQQYHDWLLTQNPALAHFSIPSVIKDLAMLGSGSDFAVIGAAFVAVWLAMKPLKASRVESTATSILPALVFYFAFLTLLLVAYLTHQQPIIFPRYGLILFGLGVPILAWVYFEVKNRKPHLVRAFLVGVVILCALNFTAQLAGAVGELHRYSAQRAAAEYLRAHFDPNSNARIFCDEGTVQVLSGIPSDRFLTSSDLPKDPDDFLSKLADKHIEWLIVANQAGSTPPRLFPRYEYSERIDGYESVFSSHSEFLSAHIWIYRRMETSP
jgi:hypothetical protein